MATIIMPAKTLAASNANLGEPNALGEPNPAVRDHGDKEEFFAIVVSLAIIGTGCLMVYWFLQPHF